MKVYHLLFINTLLWAACNNASKQSNGTKDTLQKPLQDTIKATDLSENTGNFYIDSIRAIKLDTASLQGKVDQIINENHIALIPSDIEYDTLIDLNYDNYKDLVIGYYGSSGTGVKNRVNIYLYSPQNKSFYFDSTLSEIPNISFYLKKKKITGFYLGDGAGGGVELHWIKNKWDTIMSFSVHNRSVKINTPWEIEYYPSHKKKTIFHPYQMVPPQNILEHNWD